MTSVGPRVGILFRGDRQTRDTMAIEATRLAKIGTAFCEVGMRPEAVVFDESFADEVRDQLLSLDGVLVWVDPFTQFGDRTVLDQLLAEVAQNGVFVSSHPATILKMGTKEVLYATREMEWGSDVRRYTSFDEFRQLLPQTLAEGKPRVLKQYRGNGGNGVFKVELGETQREGLSPDTLLRTRHARRGSTEKTMTLSAFVDRCAIYFENGGRMIDQAWQPRLVDGTVRCYLVCDKVIGFGEQLINALYPSDQAATEPPLPGPRLYYPATRPDFQRLKTKLEREWVPEMRRLLDVSTPELPMLWDTDFLLGPKTATGEDTYVLCEINISAVLPFPDEGLAPLAAKTLERISRQG